MKKLILFSCLLLVMISTSGCVKYEYTINIDKKNNIAFSQITALNINTIKEMSQGMPSTSPGPSEGLKQHFEQEGYKVDIYNQDGFEGVTAHKQYNMKSFKLPDGFKSNTEKPFEMKASMGGAKKTYSINWLFDIKEIDKTSSGALPEQNNNSYKDEIVSKDISTDEETGITTEKIVYQSGAVATSTYNKKEMEETSEQMSKMLTSMFKNSPELKPQVDLTIKIPTKKADKHNATDVINKNEYHWNLINLDSDQPVSIELEYSMYDFSLFGIFGTIILLLFGLAYAWKKMNE